MPPPRDQLGRPLHDLRISVIDQCNLRCTYCMPAEVFGPGYPFLAREKLLTFAEIERLARLFAGLGVAKLRLTGGEPLLRKGLPELIAHLGAIPGIKDVALTTNGLLLPRLAADLKASGLRRVTVSLDALDGDIFGRMNGRGVTADKVRAGIDAALTAGLPVKVNMVVEKGVNEQQVVPMVRALAPQGVVVRFIEFMDVGNHNGWELSRVYPARQILDDLRTHYSLTPLDAAYRSEVANRYRIDELGTEVGIIASVTQPFCRDCARARLSADGKLYTCLFASIGWDLRHYLREDALSDEALRARLEYIWGQRTDRYSEERTALMQDHRVAQKVEMSYIGG